ncbi:MAG: hypothetical protein QXT26_09105 [Thermoproteota archaeon]
MSVYPPVGSAKEVWEYPTRLLTQSKFPFWSAIIIQNQGAVSVPAASAVYIDIQPPTGETWAVEIAACFDGGFGGSYVEYDDYDGTTARKHTAHNTGGSTGDRLPHIELARILTNALYGRLVIYNADGTAARTGYYGYSGFKLSQPLWSPRRLNNPMVKPWKRLKTEPLPSVLQPLDKYAWDILGLDPNRPDEYETGITLEEDAPLAVDPETNFPIERLTVIVKADVLADLINKFKTKAIDPIAAGYRKYLDKWKSEGIDFGV